MAEENRIAQDDEIEALSAIYETEFHVESRERRVYSIDIIVDSYTSTLEMKFPPGYPSETCPTYTLMAPWLKGPKRRELHQQLDEVYINNMGFCIGYLWIEKIREFTEEYIQTCSLSDLSEQFDQSLSMSSEEETDSNQGNKSCTIPIFSGGIISDRKSHFQGHAAEVHSVEDIRLVLDELYKNKKIESATHNIYAYRINPGNNRHMIQDSNDDGENQAGGRLLHLLQILESENVLVVVTRWYGGIQLGADRFKHINNAARAILDSSGFIKEKASNKKSQKKSVR